MFKSNLILAVWLTLCSCSLAEELRTFTDTRGRSISAKFISNTDDKVSLKLSNGKEVTINISTLSAKDQQYIKNLKQADVTTAEPASAKAPNTKEAEKAAALNKAIGHTAFNGIPFTQRNAAELAQSLETPIESTSSIGGSWRLYAAAKKKGYTLFGVIPYSVALYSDAHNNARSISLVFANKGDYNSKVGFGADHFQETKGKKTSSLSLEDAMKKDYEQISSSLTQALGNGSKTYYGDSGTRNSVLRWDWNGHSFLLSLKKKEYVTLLIVSPEKADREGRSSVINDSVIKSRIQAAIKRDPNGDVYITDIPMVDQGPKGYCAPATFERAMRFVGLEADMYLLAMLGETQAGGGTSVSNLVNEIKSLVMRKGARVKEVNDRKKGLSFRDVQKNIDQGIPLLWTLASGDPYNKPTNENTKLRQKDGHADWLAKQNEIYEDEEKLTANHICMIIGYNEKTEEIAVSDSWGEKYIIRWTPLSVAQWASSGKFVTIQP